MENNNPFRGHEKSLFYYCLKLTNDTEEAKDLVQEVFVRAWKVISDGGYNDQGKMKSWLCQIAKNSFINEWRKKQTKNEVDFHRFETYTENDALQNIAVKELTGFVETLSEDSQKPLWMRQEGFSYKETAMELDISIGTIKSQIHFARQKLKRLRDAW